MVFWNIGRDRAVKICASDMQALQAIIYTW